ncbi:MAG: glutamyl-tRNA reductase, partial [Streptomycetales bacterium]
PLDRVDEALAAADVVVSCTGAAGVVVTADRLLAAAADRAEPLFVLDLALPRDIDPAAQGLDSVTVVGLEQLAEALAHDDHAPDVEAVRRIVVDEVAAFTAWQRSVGVAPTVVALRAKAAELVHAELGRLEGRLPSLDERARDEIARTVHRVVDKLLHEPTVRVKELAGMSGGVTYTDALRELFDLDPKAPEVVSRAEPSGEGGDL